MPTVFGLLNWSHDTLGYGYDRLAPNAASLPNRAFISNYQKIALLQNGELAVLKPKTQTSLYEWDLKTRTLSPMGPESAGGLLHDATAYYQSASWLFSSGRVKKSFQ